MQRACDRESLRRLLSTIRKDLQPCYIEAPGEIFLGKETLVIGTGSARQVSNLIQIIKTHSPLSNIHLIARPSLISSVEASARGSVTAYNYNSEGFFNTAGLRKEIPQEVVDTLDSSIAVFNNIWGVGYENIYTVIKDLNLKKSYIFNVEEKFSKVDLSIIKRRIKSLALNRTLSDWYWDHALSKTHDN